MLTGGSGCAGQIERLNRSILSWDWLSGRPRRAAVASAFLGEETFDKMFLLCDTRTAFARRLKETLAIILGRLRRSTAALEMAAHGEQLEQALRLHLEVLGPIARGGASMDDIAATIHVPPPASPCRLPNPGATAIAVRASPPACRSSACVRGSAMPSPERAPTLAPVPGGADRRVRRAPGAAVGGRAQLHTPRKSWQPLQRVGAAIRMVTDIAEQVPECLVTLRGASASVGKPPLLLRHGPALLLAAVGGATGVVYVRPQNMIRTLATIVRRGLLGARNIIQEHLEGPIREIYKELFYQHESVNGARPRPDAPGAAPLLLRRTDASARAETSSGSPARRDEDAGRGIPRVAEAHGSSPPRRSPRTLACAKRAARREPGLSAGAGAAAARQINTFLQKVQPSKLGVNGAGASAERSDIEIVVGVIEESMPRALNSLLFGDMLQALLIQVQALKASMEEEAAAMSALMKANQMSMQMMAAVPAIFFVGGAVYLLRRALLWVLQEPAFPRRSLNQLLRQTERLLISGSVQEALGQGPADEEHAAPKELAADLQWGNLCLLVHRMQVRPRPHLACARIPARARLAPPRRCRH